MICNSRIVPALLSGAGGGVADGVLKRIKHEMCFERQQLHETMYFS